MIKITIETFPNTNNSTVDVIETAIKEACCYKKIRTSFHEHIILNPYNLPKSDSTPVECLRTTTLYIE